MFILKVLRCVSLTDFSSVDSKGLRRMSKEERKRKEKEETRAETLSAQRLARRVDGRGERPFAGGVLRVNEGGIEGSKTLVSYGTSFVNGYLNYI